MLRSIGLAWFVLVGFAATGFAAETRYMARVRVRTVESGRTNEIQTEVSGTVGQPLELSVAGNGPLRLDMAVRDLAGTGPRQYQAEFRLTKAKEVLSSPKLTTLVDRPAQIFVGEQGGDRIEIEVLIREP